MLSRSMRGTVSIVGAGRVGKSLGRALRQRGWRMGAVVARAAVRAIGGGKAHAGLTAEVFGAEVIFITTPDGEIAGAAKELARMARGALAGRGTGRVLRGKVVLHTSGALDRSALAPLARLGAATGSLHPMQTFSGEKLPRLKGVIFAVEGDERARRAARAMARELGGAPIAVASRDKPAYHAAAALAAGHALALVEAATQTLESIGFPRRRAEQTLLPLIRETLENFERIGPRAAWTGPVERGDYAVVAKHVRALQRRPREFARAYATLARLGARVLAKNPRAKLKELEGARQPGRKPRKQTKG